MESKELVNINITYAITVGKKEGLVVSIWQHALQAAGGHGIQAGIYKGNFKRLGEAFMDFDRVICKVDGDIGIVEEIVSKVLLYNPAFYSRGR